LSEKHKNKSTASLDSKSLIDAAIVFGSFKIYRHNPLYISESHQVHYPQKQFNIFQWKTPEIDLPDHMTDNTTSPEMTREALTAQSQTLLSNMSDPPMVETDQLDDDQLNRLTNMLEHYILISRDKQQQSREKLIREIQKMYNDKSAVY